MEFIANLNFGVIQATNKISFFNKLRAIQRQLRVYIVNNVIGFHNNILI